MDEEDSTSGASSIRDIYLRWSSHDSLGQTSSDDSDDDPEIASLVSTSSSEDENENENDKDKNRNILHKSKSRSSTKTTTRTRWSLLTQNWLPEGPWQVGGHQVLEAEGVKLFKFFGITVLSILFVHYYAIVVNADRDEDYSIRQMVLYDGNHIVLDIVVFFVVGRLHQRESIDSFAWVGPSLCAAMALSSAGSNVPALHHSITGYEIHCMWGWQMWALVILGVVPLILGLVGAHVRYAVHNGSVVRKLLELAVGVTLFFVPYASQPFFHLHHWYYSWMLGMHVNLDVWWSRLTMSLLWGIYINGIAIFGRDPIMTCAVTLYQSQNQQCPYLVSDDYNLEILSSTSKDWHNCSLGMDP